MTGAWQPPDAGPGPAAGRVNGVRPAHPVPGSVPRRGGGGPVDQVDWQMVAQVRARVAGRLEAERGPAGLSERDERALAASLVGQEIEAWALARAAAGLPAVDRDLEREVAAAVTAALFGLGRLQPLLERADVENVHIQGYDRVELELADGSREQVAPVAGSDAELVEMLAGWAARLGQTGREFSPAQPLLNLRLPAGGPLGSRLAATMEVTDRPMVAVRRHRLARVTLDDLVAAGTLSQPLRAFLAAAVRAGLNMVISGAPAAGKTTLLRALARQIPAGEHVVTVEEEYELGLHVLDPGRLVTAMEARQANAEGMGGIDLHVLLRQALRHSPSRVLVGEVRGGEVTALLLALSNGAAGGMCTLHAGSAPAVMTRIAQLAAMSTPPLAPEAVWRFVADAVDLIVHLDRDPGPGGRRFVTEVLEVGAVGDTGLPDTTAVFVPAEADGRAVAGYTPSVSLQRRLARGGVAPPAGPAAPPRPGRGGLR